MSAEDEVEQSRLLDGLEGVARAERRDLIQWLLRRGFGVEQIRRSFDPILLIPNRVMGDDGTVASSRDIAEENGLPLEFVRRLHRAAGLPQVAGADEATYPRADAESILPAAALVGVGFDPKDVAVIVRLAVDGFSRVSVAMRQAALTALLKPNATEVELAMALESFSLKTQPLLKPMISQLANLAMRHWFETEAVDAAERAAGTIASARPVTVAFADLVGFTSLGEVVPPQDLVLVAGRLASLAREVISEPVQFVKMVGDAVMLVSPDPEKLVDAVLSLLDASVTERLPPLRAGAAFGLAVSRAGDWYGSPVNTASRVTDIAPPGTMLVTESTRAAIGGHSHLHWSFAKVTQLRGISDDVQLYEPRRTPRRDPPDESSDADADYVSDIRHSSDAADG